MIFSRFVFFLILFTYPAYGSGRTSGAFGKPIFEIMKNLGHWVSLDKLLNKPAKRGGIFQITFYIVRFQKLWRFFLKKKRYVSNDYGVGEIFEKCQFLK